MGVHVRHVADEGCEHSEVTLLTHSASSSTSHSYYTMSQVAPSVGGRQEERVVLGIEETLSDARYISVQRHGHRPEPEPGNGSTRVRSTHLFQ